MKQFFKKCGAFLTRLGKRNLVVVAVVLLLGLAVYLNYRWFYTPTPDAGTDGTDQNVGGQVTDTEADYFASAELSRNQSRDQALEVLQSAVDSADETVDMAATLAQISRIAEDLENEANIETLVKSCGYENCVAVINGDAATVIVSAMGEGLLATDVAQITAIVYEQAGILPVNLTVIER